MDSRIRDFEARFGIVLPDRHRAALLTPADPVHIRKDLLAVGEGQCWDIFEVNERMRSLHWKEWPDYLVAFATNGCGDYFAYDRREQPYPVYYIGPIDTATEAMESCKNERFVFACFDDWYSYVVSHGTRTTVTGESYFRAATE
jgi:hypothetical protein